MSHRRLNQFVLLALALGALSIVVAAAPPPPQAPVEGFQPSLDASIAAPIGIESIGTSTLANVTPALLPVGIPFDLCFTVFVQSPDLEYLDHMDVDLPDGWTVHSLAPDSVPPANGCSGALPPVSGVITGNVLYWQSAGYPPQTGCGAWIGGSAGANFDFCAHITLPDRSGAPWTVPWNLVGDAWGNDPHQVSGSYGPIDPVPPPILLTPEQAEGWGCACEMQAHGLTVSNTTGYDTLVNLTYALVSGEGYCNGPASLFVPDGANVPFSVNVLPAGGAGDTLECQVVTEDVANPAYTSTSSIVKHIRPSTLDPAGWQLEPITGTTPFYGAGGVVGTHPVAGEVGYVVGGWASASAVNPDLQMYDPDKAAWTQGADLPNPRWGLVAGWIDGLLYAAGGYDATYAATGDLQVYDPATDTWDHTVPADLPVVRGGGAGGVGVCSSGAGTCLFHIGGGSDVTFASSTLETWQYDPGANAWTPLDPKPAGSSPYGFAFGAGAGCLGQVYVGGTWWGTHEFYRLDATQPAGAQWTRLADIPPAAGAQMPALVCKEDWGTLVLIGGDPDGYWGTYNNTVYVYDIATDTWDGPLPQTLNVGSIGSAGWHMAGRVWTVGGGISYSSISPMPFESLRQINCDPGLCDGLFDVVKAAPANARFGEVISYTITITPTLAADMSMADPLPAGVEYADHLSWTAGSAWYSDTVNTVFWTAASTTAGAQAAGAPGAYVSQVGPDISLSIEEDGGTTVLDGPPAGVMGSSTPQGTGWTVLPAPPTEASRPAGAVDAAGRFTIIGGESSGVVRYGQVQRYDPATGTWDNSLATMPVPAFNLCAAGIGDDIYVPGGWDGSVALSDLQVYHIDSDSWEIIATDPLPAAHLAPACAAYDGKVYVIGGSFQDTTWVYDPAAAAGSRWTTLAKVPQAGAYGAALAVGDLIFYAGFYMGGDRPEVYAYDPAADAWTRYPDLATARGGAGMWAIGDRLLVGGGGWDSYLTSVEQYDTSQGAGGAWSPFEAGLVQGRRTFAYASDPVHGRLFAGNGWAGAYLAEAEQLSFDGVAAPIQITFGVTVTARCGDLIVNEGLAVLAGVEKAFEATTVVSGEAVMAVSPPGLDTLLCVDTTGTVTLSICNEGDCPLVWAASELPGDLPWLSTSPITGALSWGECQDVDVTFDATGLAPGDYAAGLAIASNDLNAPTVTVPITLTVDACAHYVYLPIMLKSH